jgi:hypothetical protein
MKLWMIITILLFWVHGAHCVLQDEGMNMEQAQQGIMAERQSAREKLMAYERQKALDEEKIKNRLSETEARLKQIQDAQEQRMEKKQTAVLSRIEKTAHRQSSGKFYFIFLVAGMAGCIYWIYKVSRN